MFRITNLQTRQQETCANRDELLAVINEKSVWVADRNEAIMLQLEQISEEGEVLDNRSVSLPLQSIVEEALDGFGLKREKKDFSFLQRQKSHQKTNDSENVSEEVSTENKKQASTAPISAPPKKGGFSQLLWKGGAIVAIGLSLWSVVLLQQQSQTIKHIENRLDLLDKKGQVEVVGRFFITNYYSGKTDKLKAFLSKDLKAEGVAAKKGERVLSTLNESVSESKGVITATFIVKTKTNKDKIKTVRLILSLKADNDSTYGYVLVDQPKFSSFGE